MLVTNEQQRTPSMMDRCPQPPCTVTVHAAKAPRSPSCDEGVAATPFHLPEALEFLVSES